ncbi:hypothetical protein COCOBI_04-7930 [Coccomyxa sp. Obi]|nr:hypothetical protein COCOBI_04-7930 [Coccomyxa sp. Obi]
MAGSLGRISVLLWVMVTLLAGTSGSVKVVPVEAVALHPSMHTLVVNAILDTPCRQQCFLLLHALENVQRDGDLDGPVQLLGNATLLQVNTVSVSQLPAATYRLTVSCSNASTCSSQPTFLHFSRLPSGQAIRVVKGSACLISDEEITPSLTLSPRAPAQSPIIESSTLEFCRGGTLQIPPKFAFLKGAAKVRRDSKRLPDPLHRLKRLRVALQQGSMDAGYEALDAPQKLEKLWNRIQESIYPAGTALPTQEPSAAEHLGLVWPPHLKPSFLHSSDIAPDGRSKLIHTFGSVAKVHWNLETTWRCAEDRCPQT